MESVELIYELEGDQNMDLKAWNKDIKHLREIILKPDKIEESIKICLELHGMVHVSEVSGIGRKTLEDELWEGLDENIFKMAADKDGNTIAYGIWHVTRIEDITMNMLVDGGEQVFKSGNWKEKINSKITDTGNAMGKEEKMEFSKNISMQELRNYRMAVGAKTREIIKGLDASDMKRKIEQDRLWRVLEEGAVLNVEKANWLIDFWGRKNAAGIILMPATRHNVVHLNESIAIKRKNTSGRK